jgi:hypothetical protein
MRHAPLVLIQPERQDQQRGRRTGADEGPIAGPTRWQVDADGRFGAWLGSPQRGQVHCPLGIGALRKTLDAASGPAALSRWSKALFEAQVSPLVGRRGLMS